VECRARSRNVIALLRHAARSWSGAAEISPERRVWCSRAHSPLFFPRGITLLSQPADELRKLSVDGVYNWAVKTAGLEEEDAAILKKQKISGKSLFELTEEKLRAYGMPGGPAIELMRAIAPYSAALAGQANAGWSVQS